MMLRFVASQSAFDYFRTTTRAYLETHVKLVALYSAKHNIFRVNNGEGGERVTQFSLALEAPNIDIICANSQRAKGWMERAFGTLQVLSVLPIARRGRRCTRLVGEIRA